MVNVAIVEDEDAAAAILSNCLDKYASAKQGGGRILRIPLS